MNSPSFPVSERRAANQAAFSEIEPSELEAVNGGTAVPKMTATEYVNEIMSHVPPSYGDPNGGPLPCGNGLPQPGGRL
jgi:hypothetical protein